MTTQQTFLNWLKTSGLILAFAFMMVLGAGSSAQAEAFPDGSMKCPGERGETLANGIRSAGNSYMLMSRNAADDLMRKTLESETKDPPKYLRGQIKDTYCISLIFDYMQALRALLSGTWIDAAIDAIISMVLEWACDAAGEVINNVLENICLPSIRLFETPTLSLPSLENRETCDGVSLAELVKVESVPAFQYRGSPEDYQRYPMSRFGRDGRY
ncbi:MAG: hypothetical protein EOM37_08075 [Proteobacteria bacterium]|nr:hypothetical protein [Alphaproteobacteria bacterium]NCC03983.1 hypothetical protein [Pseudomonadota bacterium]